jgi:hypothetical protein
MVPSTMKVPVPSEYVFPHGALFLGVEPERDFDAKGQDNQAKRSQQGLPPPNLPVSCPLCHC